MSEKCPEHGRRLTRRSFLETSLKGLGGLSLLSIAGSNVSSLFGADQTTAATSRLVISRNPKMRLGPGKDVDAREARLVLDRALMRLADTKTPKDAWAKLLSPSKDDVVGIKINCIGGRSCCTSPTLVNEIVQSLKSIGIAEQNIIIWDRRNDELEKCGFTINTTASGVRCYGTRPAAGFSEKTFTVSGTDLSFSKILSEQISILINVPILKDHGTSGMTAALKNHYGSFNNPWKFHGNNCSPYLAEINALAPIREKERLILCDAFRPLCHGGPSDRPQYRWTYGGLLAATDPVALDAIGWKIIEEQRRASGLRPLAGEGREPTYIAHAAQLQLGTADAARIAVLSEAL
jgi:uncharacterized protein (DUF362 family)